MFKKILLPIDLSDRHEKALSVAGELARASNGVVILLHVVEIIPGLPEEEDFYRRLERVARKHLSAIHDRLEREKIPSGVEVIVGNRARAIVQPAEEMGAELILLTAPRIDPDKVSAGLGSLSCMVGIFAPCPVLLVK
jgi:nucleotide-binding universal stress UspA family protein